MSEIKNAATLVVSLFLVAVGTFILYMLVQAYIWITSHYELMKPWYIGSGIVSGILALIFVGFCLLHAWEGFRGRRLENNRKKETTQALKDAIANRANVKQTEQGLEIIHWLPQARGTQVQEEQEPQKQIAAPTDNHHTTIHIPTFAESLAYGEIGPGQQEVLICYELERDEKTGQIIDMAPRKDKLENNCTLLLGGGSKSGKTTYMSHIAAQEAMMNALFYVIDPHLTHPEKSIAVRLTPFKHAFILPPAMYDADVYTVLEHAKDEAQARLEGRETRYSGRPIVFIVDEALALISRAQRTDNKDIQNLYKDLMLFMRDLGTQYNKYEINGIFATQYVTKEAFKIPGCSIDFRDACQSNALFRLPANQAQAMRLLQRDELRGIRSLPQGHGYMGFYDGDIIRMASGNVTVQDLQQVGRMVAPVSNRRTYGYCTGAFSTGDLPKRSYSDTVVTSTLQDIVNPLEKSVPMGTERGTEQVQNGYPQKKFTPEQELQFLKLYAEKSDIKWCLKEMHLGVGTYHTHASEVAKQRKSRSA